MKELYCVCVTVEAGKRVAEIIRHVVHEDGAVAAAGPSSIISGRLAGDFIERCVGICRTGARIPLNVWIDWSKGVKEMWTESSEAAEEAAAEALGEYSA